ncbi:sugar nucleotide-binding protein [Sulfurimonas sp. NW7]|uniref:NAD-dependent epimerase/dehydratase family protein n=1 Tax=Sulfurimonas sp. NW7 TaxID=2922727 RepID=UPI003DAA00CD
MYKKLIIGKNGFIAQKLQERNTQCSVTTSCKDDKESVYLNLLNSEEFDYSMITADTSIIFLAAISSPDECNNNYEYAYKINVIGTKYFISEALSRGAKVLFFSSDVIYGNTEKAVDEDSATNPFGNYAKMKDEIEKFFEKEKNFKVFRLSYVLSKEDKYLSYLSSCIRKNEVAEVFHPFTRKVVYIEDVLEAIEQITKKWDSFSNQKFNICGEEDISRKNIADFFNECMSGSLKYELITPQEEFWEARPKDINITSKYFHRLIGRKPTKIENAIKQIIEQGE